MTWPSRRWYSKDRYAGSSRSTCDCGRPVDQQRPGPRPVPVGHRARRARRRPARRRRSGPPVPRRAFACDFAHVAIIGPPRGASAQRARAGAVGRGASAAVVRRLDQPGRLAQRRAQHLRVGDRVRVPRRQQPAGAATGVGRRLAAAPRARRSAYRRCPAGPSRRRCRAGPGSRGCRRRRRAGRARPPAGPAARPAEDVDRLEPLPRGHGHQVRASTGAAPGRWCAVFVPVSPCRPPPREPLLDPQRSRERARSRSAWVQRADASTATAASRRKGWQFMADRG